MHYTVRARSGTFGGMGVGAASAAEALAKARDLAEDETLTISIVDALGVEHEADAFARLTGDKGVTAGHLGLIQGTCDVLLSANSRAADIFYDRLFELAPETRPLFKTDLGDQKLKLSEMLASIVGHLTHPDMFAALVHQLGRRHAHYGVQPEHYGPVGAALLASLAELLGPRFTPDVQAAWTALYVQISDRMMQAQNSPG